MTKCPKCNATLPDGSFACQFCGTQFAAAPPAASGKFVSGKTRSGSSMPGAPGWVVPAYNIIAAWWIIDGVWTILKGTVLASDKESGGLFTIIVMIIGGVTALVGLGLLLRVDAVRGIVNVLCFLQILDGAFGLITGFFLTGIFGIWGAIGMIMSVIRIGQAGFMIYLIGETDTRAPNF